MQLVTVLDRRGELVEHRDQVGGRLLGGDGDQFHGQLDAAARRAGVVELLDDLILRRDRFVAQHVAFGLLGRNRNPRVLGHQLLGDGPPFLELFLAEGLLEDDLKIDGGGGLVGKGRKRFDHQLDRFLLDQLGDLFRLGFLPHEQMLGRQDVEGPDAERGIHPVLGLPLEVNEQLLIRIIIFLDLAKPPAPVDAVSARLHGLKFGFGRLERRVFGDERLNGFGIHNCGVTCVKR